MILLFIDFDGCLNTPRLARQGMLDPRLVTKLNRVVEATGCKIVLSTTWRLLDGLEGCKAKLAECGLQDADSVIVGETEDLWEEDDRSLEIADYLDRQTEPVVTFCVIDDDRSLFISDISVIEHTVFTDRNVGLSEANIQDVIRILNAC
jgi:hypothetical protein